MLEITYAGRAYDVLAVGFEDAHRLRMAALAFQQLQDEPSAPDVVTAAAAAAELVERLALRYLRPRTGLERLLWALRLHRNPFRHSTAHEVGQLLGFMLGTQHTSRVVVTRSPIPGGVTS